MREGSPGRLRVGLTCACAALGACSTTAPRRAQLLLVVDTDAHVVGEAASDPNVSADSAIDSLRVDVLDADAHPYASQIFVVSSPSSWPVSFGIEPSPSGAGTVMVRLRAFRALFATAGETGDGGLTLDPAIQVTIDRLVELGLPSSGEQVAAVELAEDCMGTPISLAAPRTTCLDGAHLTSEATQGVASSPPATSQVGTWAPAIEVPCASQGSSDQQCIPGGFAILGDLSDVGTTGASSAYDPAPLRPVVVAPFWLDTTEFTVGMLRTLVQSGQFTQPLPATVNDPTIEYSEYCTWHGASDGSWDGYPVNCIGYASAALACSLRGRRLPTEPEWEFAARGRGQRSTFPWGESFPQCCTASLSRGVDATCGAGPEPVGSHRPSASCSVGDMSRDGVLDMGGSVDEIVSTVFAPYADPCWTSGAIVRDAPQCSSVFGQAERGTDWSSGLATAFGAQRRSGDPNTVDTATGFRCASDGGP